MNKNIFRVTLFSLITSGFVFSRDKPNILWIVGENLKLDLGCYGAKNVKTPNLDKLAAQGERYTKVFSTSGKRDLGSGTIILSTMISSNSQDSVQK